MDYIDSTFKNSIGYAVNDMYPNLNVNHKNLLHKYLIDIINFTATKFNFDMNNKSKYYHQLSQNNYEDIKSFLNLLLPYVDDSRKSTQHIKSLNDIYVQKQDTGDLDIRKYEFSNLQYGRCKRLPNNVIEEVQFNVEHLEHNHYLLKDTIQIISNKLHVNWLNIRPHSLDSVKTKDIYKLTKQSFDNNNISYYDPVVDNNDQRSYRGLYTGDIYNVIRNYLYEDIVPIKWLIFDVNINNKLTQIINVINSIFDIEFDINTNWTKLTDSNRSSFIKRWNSIIDSTKNNESIYGYSQNIIKYITKVVTVFFDKRYGRSDDTIERGYVPINVELSLDDEIIREDKNDDSIMRSAQTISADMIYDFITNSLVQYDTTWYGKQTNTIIGYSKNIQLTLKNIYNYAKSLSSYTVDNTFSSYSKCWRGLSTSDKTVILSRLNFKEDDNVMSWFNIGRYIQYTYGKKADVEQINNDIYKMIHKRIIDIIFDVLISQGILTEFSPLKEVTDKKYIPKDTKKQGKYVTDTLKTMVFDPNMSRWNNTFYFLTGTKFSEVMHTYKNIKKSYLQSIIDGDAMYWMGFYAFSWISQIALFHRYIHCRIIYVTGATGVGKSAAVPRLMLYGLKMIDYKNRGKIANSQPRQSPTEGNPTGMAIAMGVPLTEFSSDLSMDTPTDNYYLQFKHKKKSHTGSSKGLTLKVVTDGTLYQIIKDNPICKNSYKDPTTKDIIFKEDNLYDIFMIDEAHEHNRYIDMILSLLRYSCYYNNDIKLVIVSATMEEDEPVYRRFYRNVNDNRLFPFNYTLIEHQLDRINIDRRVHISPPGATTRFKIDDYYMPNNDADDIVVNIINSTASGEILLFRPGLKEIHRSVDNLINKLPNNVLLLPFHSKLTNEKRNFIEKLTPDSIKEYTIPRHIKFDDDTDLSDVKRVPVGTYTRAVIIATTIAEASITINSLVFVVDTGTQKVEVYDYDSKTSKLETRYISDASRKQRRGRVGRKAPGVAYYTYEKGLTDNIKTQYDISISDVSQVIFDILRSDANDSPLIREIDLTNPETLKYGIKNMASKQYSYKGMYVSYTGNPKFYDYENSVEPPVYYKTGYSSNTLYDPKCVFYIVHPEELFIERDILGHVSKIKDSESIGFNKDTGKIESKKMESFFDSLMEKQFVKKLGNDYTKSLYGHAISQVMSSLEISPELAISYFYSRKYEVSDNFIYLLAMHNILGGNLKNMAYSADGYDRYTELRSLYSNQYGDSKGLVNMANDILKYSDSIGIFYENIRNKDTLKYLKKQYMAKNYNVINKDILEKFVEADRKNKLLYNDNISEQEIIDIFGHMPKIAINENDKIIQKLFTWAKGNYMNGNYVYNFLKEYVYLVDNISEFIDNEADAINYIDDMIDIRYSSNKDNLLIASLLHGIGYRVSKRIGGSRFYMSATDPSPKKTYILRPNDTLIQKVFIGEYVIYNNYNPIKDTISIIDNVTPDMVQKCVPNTFSLDRMNSEMYKDRYQTNLLNDELVGISSKDIALIKDYISSVQKIRKDMIKNYIPNTTDNNTSNTINNQKGGFNFVYQKRDLYVNRFVYNILREYMRRKQ